MKNKRIVSTILTIALMIGIIPTNIFATQTYDGSEKSAIIENSNITNGILTYIGSNYNSTTPPTDVGIYEVFVSVLGDNNYNDASNLTDNWTFEILKSQLTIKDAKAVAHEYNGTNIVQLTGTLDGDVSILNSSLDFAFKNDSNLLGKIVEVPITISSTNYADFTLTITLYQKQGQDRIMFILQIIL